jgi:hypothetical protein
VTTDVGSSIPSRQIDRVLEDRLKGIEGRGTVDVTACDLPVESVERLSGGGASPDYRDQAHGERNGTDAII